MRELAFWAKIDASGGTGDYHPLPCHLADVAAVAENLWDLVLSPGIRTRVAQAFKLTVAQARSWVVFLAGLHDIGKACPEFQLRPVAEGLHHLLSDFPRCRPDHRGKAPHGTVTALALKELLVEESGLDRKAGLRLAVAVGGHHGLFPGPSEMRAVPQRAAGLGPWEDARRNLYCWLRDLVGVAAGFMPTDPGTAPSMFLAGLVSVADWIGSNTVFFPFEAHEFSPPPSAMAEYLQTARERARRALEALGWLEARQPEAVLDFQSLFDYTPRPLQALGADLAAKMTGPRLLIAEAPMGEGKTEFALHHADYLSATGDAAGLYFGLPSQATSNQMLGRVEDYLLRRYPGEKVQLHLLHGHASLSAEFQRLRQAGTFEVSNVFGEDQQQASINASEWFTFRKRGLLSPYGVGTIDQALLAALRTRHVFVRLFGLAHKVLIVDEVHAYDAYMSDLLDRLVEWMASLGSSVILLSATLPNRRRTEIVAAYRKGLGLSADVETQAPDYPRVSWANSDEVGCLPVGTSKAQTRTVAFRWMEQDLAQFLKGALAGGGCAAVLCNTVDRAQETFRQLHATLSDQECELDLLHARFRYKDRMERENRILSRYGKKGERPHRAIVVATQILEQSLDLDFDIMVSDAAPVDLLLQRMGRLQRHKRPRPAGLEAPVFWIFSPGSDPDGLPVFEGGTAAIYSGHILLRTWLELRHGRLLNLPEDIGLLVEAVYDERPCPNGLPGLSALWEKTLDRLNRDREAMQRESRQRWLPMPTYPGHLADTQKFWTEEDEPQLHPALQAMTRLASPSVPVVCLDGENPRTVTEHLELSVKIGRRGLVQKLLAQEVPREWSRSALLRHMRPLDLSSGSVRLDSFVISHDDQLGLVIRKETA